MLKIRKYIINMWHTISNRVIGNHCTVSQQCIGQIQSMHILYGLKTHSWPDRKLGFGRFDGLPILLISVCSDPFVDFMRSDFLSNSFIFWLYSSLLQGRGFTTITWVLLPCSSSSDMSSCSEDIQSICRAPSTLFFSASSHECFFSAAPLRFSSFYNIHNSKPKYYLYNLSLILFMIYI